MFDGSVERGSPGQHLAATRILDPTSTGARMGIDINALDSMSSTLQELTDRISHLLVETNEEDDAVAELREVERQLQSSTRRLSKIVRRVQRQG